MNELRNTVIRELRSKLGEEYQITASDVRKNNGVVLHGVVIRRTGQDVAPTVYMEQLMESYQDGSSAIPDIVDRIIKSIDSADVPEGVPDSFADYEKVRDKIRVGLVNYEANQEMLKTRPHKKYLDLAVISYIDLSDPCGGTIQIYNELCRKWKVSEEEVMRQGLENLCSHGDYELCSIVDVCRGLMGLEECPEMIDEAVAEVSVVTNHSRYYGAGCMLNRAMLYRAADKVDADLFIYPSSIHDLILSPARPGEHHCLGTDLIREINQEVVIPEERLSNSVYLFDRSTGEVSIYQQGRPLSQAA